MLSTLICSINYRKFLGNTIGIPPTTTCKLASDNVKHQHIDNCSIRGECKSVDPKNFVTSAFHFHIAVESLTVTVAAVVMI